MREREMGGSEFRWDGDNGDGAGRFRVQSGAECAVCAVGAVRAGATKISNLSESFSHFDIHTTKTRYLSRPTDL